MKTLVAHALFWFGEFLDWIPAVRRVDDGFKPCRGLFGCSSGYCHWVMMLDERWKAGVYT